MSDPTAPFCDDKLLTFLLRVSSLVTTNPFEPAWEERHKFAMGDGYVPVGCSGLSRGRTQGKSFERLENPIAVAVAGTAFRLWHGGVATRVELAAFQGSAIYCMWQLYGPRLQGIIDRDEVDVPFYDEFLANYHQLLGYPGLTAPGPAHLLALFYQVRRAWYFPSWMIRGASPSTRAARAALFRASVTGDLCNYAEGLYRRMDDFPVLITGESGTGKELAARCIGWSRYIPFDPETRRFVMKHTAELHVRNLSEVSDELIESTLFGHRRGSFTGATCDRTGWFALPGAHGSLFFDEIGELRGNVQTMLLRPIESREIVPIGETRPIKIVGRHIFATHQPLEALCAAKKFRRDLFERMNSVRIRMPSLQQIIAEAPEELRSYVRLFVEPRVDNPARVDVWTDRVVGSIEKTLSGYAWPGNIRELKHYTERYILDDGHVAAPDMSAPAAASVPTAASTGLPSSGILGPRAKRGEVTADQLNRSYVNRVHTITNHNRTETARRTGLNWRTLGKWLREPKKPDGEPQGE